MVKEFRGVALMPRKSRNDVYYDVDELKKFDGKSVPLRVEHRGPESDIGFVTFTFDEEYEQVKYHAKVVNPEWQQRLENMNFKVSIGASVLEPRELCDAMRAKCLDAPVLGEILELSIVNHTDPGVPETTVNIMEMDTASVTFNSNIPTYTATDSANTTFTINTSDMTILEKNDNMSNDKQEKVEEAVQEVPKTETKTEEKVEENKPEIKIDTEKIATEISNKVETKANEKVESIIREIRDNWTPKSEVAEKTTGFVEEAYTEDEAKKLIEHLKNYGYLRIPLDKEGWINSHTNVRETGTGSVQEAVSTSGTIPGITKRGDIKIQLGSKSVIPIRQYGQFQAIGTGDNTARFYRINVPDAGAITESATTDITAVTHTLTSISVTCSIRGWRQVVEKAELEDYPASFLNALRETARMEAIRDEHRLIVQDLAATDHDFGGTTTAPYHISGSDGVAQTTTTLEDACGEFDETGIVVARRLLEQLGNDVTPGSLIAFISPRAYQSLITASAISTFTQYARPGVTALGVLEQLYGVDIIVTNELLVANNAYRNLVCVKGAAWGLASQRGMDLELQKTISGQYWDIVWTHRIGVDIIDPNAYVIVSSIQA